MLEGIIAVAVRKSTMLRLTMNKLNTFFLSLRDLAKARMVRALPIEPNTTSTIPIKMPRNLKTCEMNRM